MSLNAQKEFADLTPDSSKERKRRSLSEVLLSKRAISPSDMLKAVALQNHGNARLSELLIGLGLATEDVVLEAISERCALPIVDLEAEPPDPKLSQLSSPNIGIKYRFVVWKQLSNITVVALSDPELVTKVRGLLGSVANDCRFVLAPTRAILRYYETHHRQTLSEAANKQVPKVLSCRTWAGRGPKLWGAGLLGLFILGALLIPKILTMGLFFWVLFALIANGIYKITMLVAQAKHAGEPQNEPRPKKLPKISILLPLLREEDIVDRLVKRMSALVYPKELLDICLIYEENDTATRTHLQNRKLPYWMRTIEVPQSTLQTKPRAMNFALDFCTGDIIGIYDAEDAPEPDQLYRVAQKFDKAADNVACVQCQLDYYNSQTNWISRCFSIEYATLFRVILPGLVYLGLPVPLGGTSVFFRRDHLESLGRWDAHNVTEDADLGIRLHRLGYRCEWSSATTYEEANFRIIPWMKQRSRWLKGFLQTWLTHMRHPFQTLKELGPLGFLAFQIQMIGTFSSFAAMPLVVPLWAFTFGYTLPVYEAIPQTFFWILIICFLLTEGLLLLLSSVAVLKRGDKKLLWFVPTMLLYWPLGAFAAYKALWELFVHPQYWDKTEHGINDCDYQSEIDRLTASADDSEKTYSPGSVMTIGG